MAGDWIKVEAASLDKPEVLQLAQILKIDPDAVVGKLLRVWFWFDSNTVDGNASNVTLETLALRLDRVVGVPGFICAMRNVGWLDEDAHGAQMVNFDYHNGKSAKNRALTNRRVAKHRKESNEGVTNNVTAQALQKPLPEKRREEKSKKKKEKQVKEIGNAQSALALASRFEAFWRTYPLKKDKARAQKAFEKIKPDFELLALMIQAVEAQGAEKDRERKATGFAPRWPNPTTWLNGERWEDEPDTTPINGSKPQDWQAFAADKGIQARAGETEFQWRDRVKQEMRA